jgi:DNA-binding PadR family transcriptional regulator
MKPKHRFPGSLFRRRANEKQSQRLGSFEVDILDAVQTLGTEANQIGIRKLVEQAQSWPVSIGAVAAHLQRLEEEGQVSTWSPEDAPGSRDQLVYRVTDIGLASLVKTRTRNA